VANSTGKSARKAHGNRFACKKAKAKPMTAKYAVKVARWVEEEKERERRAKGNGGTAA